MHAETIAAGAYPSPLNYWNFPKSVCTSVNEVICHGIPDKRPLQVGFRSKCAECEAPPESGRLEKHLLAVAGRLSQKQRRGGNRV